MKDSVTPMAVVGFFIGAVGIFAYTLLKAVKINQKFEVKKKEQE